MNSSKRFVRVDDIYELTYLNLDDHRRQVVGYYTSDNKDMANKRFEALRKSGNDPIIVFAKNIYVDENNNFYNLKIITPIMPNIPDRQSVLAKLTKEERKALGL